MYKEKQCQFEGCTNIFTPTSGKQKYCPECSIKAQQIKDRIRWRDKNRKENNYTEQIKTCRFCGKEFSTYYKKKTTCGELTCERARQHTKNVVADAKRQQERLANSIISLEQKNVDVLKEAEYLFSLENYKVIDTSKVKNTTVGHFVVSCPNGHEWETTLTNFKNQGRRCSTCYHQNNYVSKPEQQVRNFFTKNFPTLPVVYNDREQLAPKELDLYFPDQKVAVEICGLYWHSEVSGGKPKYYHYNKMKACNEKGIRLITVFEDELNNRFNVVMSRIVQALNLTEAKVFARNCEVKLIDNKSANIFLEINHLQGKSQSSFSFGLVYGDLLIGVATFGKLTRAHLAKQNAIELKRLCFLPFLSVIGGASKLFVYALKYLKSINFCKVVSYCDLRYANYNKPIYSSLGFVKKNSSKYTPHYVMNGLRFRNFSLRKTKEEQLTGKTEFELRQEQGYDRIWDCGHISYELVIN